jgi:hypothetical protein
MTTVLAGSYTQIAMILFYLQSICVGFATQELGLD